MREALTLALAWLLTGAMIIGLWWFLFGSWRMVALAAGLLGLFALAGWIGNLQPPVPYNGIDMADDDEDPELDRMAW